LRPANGGGWFSTVWVSNRVRGALFAMVMAPPARVAVTATL